MKTWTYLDDADTTRVGFRTIIRKRFAMSDGREKIADIAGERGLAAAFVIALTPENRVIIARQFRCGPERILDELPGGLVEASESPEQAAMREMREEIGYASDDVTPIGFSYTDAWDHLTRHYFLARDCYPVESNNPDTDEEIEVVTISIEELIDNAKKARMIDAQGVFLVYEDLMKIKEEMHETAN